MSYKEKVQKAGDDVFAQRLKEMHDEELLTYIRGVAGTLTTLADRLEAIVEEDGEDAGARGDTA